jgi:hypothetical protein
MSHREYDCSNCGEMHSTVLDEDGYELANCRGGTILVSTPEDRQ